MFAGGLLCRIENFEYADRVPGAPESIQHRVTQHNQRGIRPDLPLKVIDAGGHKRTAQ